ncbi:MAG TPA: hypothetical protein VGF08_04315 [Terriglobales bacterium]|jgi:hypothetical protein
MPDQLSLSISIAAAQSGLPDGCEQRFLEVLLDLEASLRASQEALLARDLGKIEQLTREQMDLQRALGAMVEEPGLKQVLQAIARGHVLWATHRRVLQLSRVQCALLRRAQQSLRTLSCWLAGTNSQYGTAAETPRMVVPTMRIPLREG